MNLFDLLQGPAESEPSRPALVFGARTITYSQLMSASLRVSAQLRRLGVEPGARVLMYAPNCPEYLPIYLGCAHAGAIFAPVNIAFRAREMSYVLDNAKADVAFVHKDVLQQFRSMGADTRNPPPSIIEFDSKDAADGFESLFSTSGSAADSPMPALDCPGEHGALLCYTSGTTSAPKPVLHSHYSEIYAAKGYVAAWRMERSDRGLVTLPLAWIYGLSSASLALLVAGATVVLMTHFNPERALEAIEKARATVFFGSMSMYTKMFDVLTRRDFDLSSLRLCTNGGEPCPDALVRGFEQRTGLRLMNAYALSEARPLLAQDPLDVTAPTGTCGQLVSGGAIRLLDDSGQEVSAGAVGEAFIRCPGMLSAYFREPLLTEQRLSADGWLKTGDLLRKDPSGYYFVTGRTSEMIIRSGVNIAPAEIEAALLENAQIAQAIVTGVPDAISGQAIVAFVVLASEASLTDEQLRDHVRARIADYKVPQKFILRDDLPTNVSGKLDRAALEAIARQAMTPTQTTEPG